MWARSPRLSGPVWPACRRDSSGDVRCPTELARWVLYRRLMNDPHFAPGQYPVPGVAFGSSVRRRGNLVRNIVVGLLLAALTGVVLMCSFGNRLTHLSPSTTPVPEVSPVGITFGDTNCGYISAWGFEAAFALPSSVSPGERLVETIDGQPSDDFPIDSVDQFTRQADGTWTATAHMSTEHVLVNCALHAGDLAYGVHTIKLSDESGHMLAQGYYEMSGLILIRAAAKSSGPNRVDVDCHHPSDVTTKIYLPSSTQDGEILTMRDGGKPVGTITVDKSLLARQDDGTWLWQHVDSAADIATMCANWDATYYGVSLQYGFGDQSLEVVDEHGYVLAEGSWYIVGVQDNE